MVHSFIHHSCSMMFALNPKRVPLKHFQTIRRSTFSVTLSNNPNQSSVTVGPYLPELHHRSWIMEEPTILYLQLNLL